MFFSKLSTNLNEADQDENEEDQTTNESDDFCEVDERVAHLEVTALGDPQIPDMKEHNNSTSDPENCSIKLQLPMLILTFEAVLEISDHVICTNLVLVLTLCAPLEHWHL